MIPKNHQEFLTFQERCLMAAEILRGGNILTEHQIRLLYLGITGWLGPLGEQELYEFYQQQIQKKEKIL